MKLGKDIPLKRNEEIVRIVRRYGLTYLFPVLIAGVSLFAGFFFMFWLFRHGWWGEILFALAIGFGLWLGATTLSDRYRNTCYITNHRIVDVTRRGFFDCTVSDIPYDQIEDISGRVSGVSETLFRYGSVWIQAGSGSVHVVIDRVKHPVRLQRLIHDLREVYAGIRGAQESTDLLLERIETASMQEITQLHAAVQRRLRTLRDTEV
jgi:hypothetical protein